MRAIIRHYRVFIINNGFYTSCFLVPNCHTFLSNASSSSNSRIIIAYCIPLFQNHNGLSRFFLPMVSIVIFEAFLKNVKSNKGTKICAEKHSSYSSYSYILHYSKISVFIGKYMDITIFIWKCGYE